MHTPDGKAIRWRKNVAGIWNPTSGCTNVTGDRQTDGRTELLW